MEHYFDTREEASFSAAGRMAELLDARLAGNGKTAIVVSGGSSPKLCFEKLAQTELDWQKVSVVPSDERWVDASDPESNERMIRETLLTGEAAAATLLPIYKDGETHVERCESLDAELRTLPIPFACTLLGMGADAHFASLFPDYANLDKALNSENGLLCVPVQTRASPHPRISLTMTTLTRTDEIILLFFGDEKLTVYEQAKAESNGFPVSRLLRQKRAPVRVYWAP
ncbi:MAG: 6-phosphogluconolactonase [Woeseiaceae bacterium]|nr:6-phosphogluconolactonase [Woeseiaceae bacterium]